MVLASSSSPQQPPQPEPGLSSGEQVCRLAVLAEVLRCSLSDVLDVWSWLNGWSGFPPGSFRAPELVVSRLASREVAVRQLATVLPFVARTEHEPPAPPSPPLLSS